MGSHASGVKDTLFKSLFALVGPIRARRFGRFGRQNNITFPLNSYLDETFQEAYKEHHDCQQQLQSAIRTNHQKASLQEANDLLAKWEEDGYEYEDDDEDSGSFETNELGHISG